jgi:hypothetical protein
VSWAAQAAGIRVIDDVLGFLGVPIEKAEASPLTRRGFNAIVRALATALETAATPARRRAVRVAVERLDRDWPRLSEAEREEAFRRAATAVTATVASGAAAASAPIEQAAHNLIQATRQATARAHKLRVEDVFTARDVRAAMFAQSNAGFFMRTTGGRIVSGALDKAARDVVQRAIAEGWDHHDTGAELEKTLANTAAARSLAYHEMVASVAMARARTYSQLQAFEDAGITTYAFQSVLDEVTSDVCRFMHGKTFDVRTVLRRMQEVESGPPGSIVELQPFGQVGRRPDGSRVLFVRTAAGRTELADIVRSAVGTKDAVGEFRARLGGDQLQQLGCCQPPLHPHCRSVLVPGPTQVISVPTGSPQRPPTPAAAPRQPDVVVEPAPGPFEVRVRNGRPLVGPAPRFLPQGSDYVAAWRRAGAPVNGTNEAIERVFGPGRVPAFEEFGRAWTDGGIHLQALEVSAWRDKVTIDGMLRDRAGDAVNDEVVRRHFRRENGVLGVDHALQILIPGKTPKGFGTKVIGNAMRLYTHLGADFIEVHAAWSGRFAWPSLGFDWMSHGQPAEFARRLDLFFKRHGITRSAKAVAELAKHPWDIVDQSDGQLYVVPDESPGAPDGATVSLRLGQLFFYEQPGLINLRLNLKDRESLSFQRAEEKTLVGR